MNGVENYSNFNLDLVGALEVPAAHGGFGGFAGSVAFAPSPVHEHIEIKKEFWITPEGYDVSDPPQAVAYLRVIHGRKLPEITAGSHDDIVLAILEYLENEKRAALYADGETHQNVAEHSLDLESLTSKHLAERAELDAQKVYYMSLLHDAIEAYCGDTVITDPVGMTTKLWREKAAMTLLKRDLGDHPLVALLEEYEQQASPEARYVNAMDKVEAYQFAYEQKAVLHKLRGEDFYTVARVALPKAAIDPTAFREMQIALRMLGYRWHEWVDPTFDGKPDEIIDSIVNEIVTEMKARAEDAKKLEYLPVALPLDKFNLFAILPEDCFTELAPVANFAAYKAQRENPEPPQPPLPPPTPLFLTAA